MSTMEKYLNTDTLIPFKDAEKIAEKIIEESDYSEKRKEKFKKTLWHEFGHAIASRDKKQLLVSMRVHRIFIRFHNNKYCTMWTFKYLAKYEPDLIKHENKKFKMHKLTRGNGECFMRINNMISDEDLSSVLLCILNANNRHQKNRNYQIFSSTSDIMRERKIQKELINNKYNAAKELQENLNIVSNENIEEATSDKERIHIYGILAVRKKRKQKRLNQKYHHKSKVSRLKRKRL